MWFKSICKTNFLLETHLTLFPIIKKKNINGTTNKQQKTQKIEIM